MRKYLQFQLVQFNTPKKVSQKYKKAKKKFMQIWKSPDFEEKG